MIVDNDILALCTTALKVKRFDLLDLTEKQCEALERLTDEETKEVLYGGAAGGGKSWLGCEFEIWMCLTYPGSKWFIGREELKRITQSTYITFQKVCKKHGVKMDVHYKYNGQYNYIQFTNGSRIDFLDLRYQPRDPLYERFGSLEYTGGWIEEAGEINFGAYDVLKSRIGRHMNDEYNIKSKILITCNPKKNWLYTEFYKPWKEGTIEDTKVFMQAFVQDNRHIESDYEENLKGLKDQSKKERLLFGNWDYDDDPTALIDYDSICDLFNNDFVKQTGQRYITADIAGRGSDKFVLIAWIGLVAVEVQEFPKTTGKEIIEAIKALQKEYSVKASNIIFDADGIGGFVSGSTDKEKAFIPGAKEFVNGSSAKYGENYENLKTQCYFRLAEFINEGFIWLKAKVSTSAEEAIKEELQQVKERDKDKDGKLKIVRKEDIKKNIGRSPDYSDTLMMRMLPELKKSKKKDWFL